MSQTFLTVEELSKRIKFSPRYIQSHLRDVVFHEGKHYVRPFKGKRDLYIWEEIEAELLLSAVRNMRYIPMAGGRICHG